MTVPFLSVCSGIETASLALVPVGFHPVGFAETDKFASRVLVERHGSNMPGDPFPSNGVPNHGDFTGIDVKTIGKVSLLVGGTPCQAFSISGLRMSLADARGNLTLAYTVLAHELARHNGLRVTLWENVPGVLNTKDNAFGCFLGALVGHDGAIPAPRGNRWPDAGMVGGPRVRIAWRVLNAQHFGLAQRRRRVFVVACFGDGADPAKILFEPQGLRGNFEAGIGARQEVAGSLRAGSRRSGQRVGRREAAAGHVIVAPLMDVAASSASHVLDEPGALVAYGISADLYDRSGEGADSTPGERSGLGITKDLAQTLRAKRPGGVAVTCAADSVHNVAYGGNNCSGPIKVAAALNAHGGPAGRLDFESETFIVTPPLTGNPYGDHESREGLLVTHALRGEGFDASEDGTGRGTPIVPVAFDCKSSGQRGFGVGEIAPTMRSMSHKDSHQNGGGYLAVFTQVGVRRLMPVECERLQGIPDGHTDILGSADGPRYKTIGNAFPVPVIRWIGKRMMETIVW